MIRDITSKNSPNHSFINKTVYHEIGTYRMICKIQVRRLNVEEKITFGNFIFGIVVQENSEYEINYDIFSISKERYENYSNNQGLESKKLLSSQKMEGNKPDISIADTDIKNVLIGNGGYYEGYFEIDIRYDRVNGAEFLFGDEFNKYEGLEGLNTFRIITANPSGINMFNDSLPRQIGSMGSLMTNLYTLNSIFLMNLFQKNSIDLKMTYDFNSKMRDVYGMGIKTNLEASIIFDDDIVIFKDYMGGFRYYKEKLRREIINTYNVIGITSSEEKLMFDEYTKTYLTISKIGNQTYVIVHNNKDYYKYEIASSTSAVLCEYKVKNKIVNIELIGNSKIKRISSSSEVAQFNYIDGRLDSIDFTKNKKKIKFDYIFDEIVDEDENVDFYLSNIQLLKYNDNKSSTKLIEGLRFSYDTDKKISKMSSLLTSEELGYNKSNNNLIIKRYLKEEEIVNDTVRITNEEFNDNQIRNRRTIITTKDNSRKIYYNDYTMRLYTIYDNKEFDVVDYAQYYDNLAVRVDKIKYNNKYDEEKNILKDGLLESCKEEEVWQKQNVKELAKISITNQKIKDEIFENHENVCSIQGYAYLDSSGFFPARIFQEIYYNKSGTIAFNLLLIAKCILKYKESACCYVIVYYENQENTEYTFDFKQNHELWQIINKTIIVSGDITKIEVGVKYRGASSISISAISLTEEGGFEYQNYDQYGNFIGSNYDSNEREVKLDSNLNVIEEDNIFGEITKISYNANDEVERVETDNVVVLYTYDNEGNVVRTSIKGKNDKSEHSSYLTVNSKVLDGSYISNYYDNISNFEEHKFDEVNNVISSRINAENTSYEYGFDVDKIIYPSNVVEEYHYDSNNYLEKMISIDDKVNECSYSYCDGLITSIILKGGASYDFTYNKENKLKEVYINKELYCEYREEEIDNGSIFKKIYSADAKYNITIEVNVDGLLMKLIEGSIVYTFEYTKNKLIKKIICNGKIIKEVNYSEAGLVTDVTSNYDFGKAVFKECVDQFGNVEIKESNIISDDETKIHNIHKYSYAYQNKELGFEKLLKTVQRKYMDDIGFAKNKFESSLGMECQGVSYNPKYEIDSEKNIDYFVIENNFDCVDLILDKVCIKKVGTAEYSLKKYEENKEKRKTLYTFLRFRKNNDVNPIEEEFLHMYGQEQRSDEEVISLADVALGINKENKLYFRKEHNKITLFEMPECNKWTLIGIELVESDEALTSNVRIIVNDYIYELKLKRTYKYVDYISRCTIGTNISSPYNDEKDRAYIIDVAAVSYGVIEKDLKDIKRMYKYINEVSSGQKYDKVTYSQGTDDIKYISFDNSLISNKFDKPNAFIYQDRGNKQIKNNYFRYDEELKRYVYEAQNYLAYDLIDSDYGKLGLTFRFFDSDNGVEGIFDNGNITYNDLESNLRCIMSFHSRNGYRFGAYIEDNYLVFKTTDDLGNKITENTKKILLEPNIWHKLFIDFVGHKKTIKINEEELEITTPPSLLKIVEIGSCGSLLSEVEKSQYTYKKDLSKFCVLNGEIKDLIYKPGKTKESYDELLRQVDKLVETKYFKDDFNRLKSKTTIVNNKSFTTSYKYKVVNNNDTFLVREEYNDILDNKILYTYDRYQNVNRVTEYDKGELVRDIEYTYDKLCRLQNVLDRIQKQRTIYRFNDSSSIKYKEVYDSLSDELISKEEYIYDTIKKDYLLSVRSYNNSNTLLKEKRYTYNPEVYGTPLRIDGNELVFEGKILTRYGNNKYYYDESGIRTKKEVYDSNNALKEITNVYLDGSNVIHINIDDKYYGRKVDMSYIYDINNMLMGFVLNKETYLYVRDSLLNINKIIDSRGSSVVSYSYDAYGNHSYKVEQDSEVASIIGLYNPFIYKGYYYDKETGLFLITSKFYDPETGRYISACEVEELSTQNISGMSLYSYAVNNPITITAYTEGIAKKYGINSVNSMISYGIGGFASGGSGSTSGGNVFFNQPLFTPLKFRSNLIFGSLSATGMLAEWQVRAQISFKKGKFVAGVFGKFSLLNVNGQIGFGGEDVNLSLKGVVDVGTVSGMAGIMIDPSKGMYFAGLEAKASVFTARGGVQLEIFGVQIETGVAVEVLSIGGRVGIGVTKNADGKHELYVGGGLSVLFGIDGYLRIRLW